MEMVVEGQNRSKIAPKKMKFEETVEKGEEDRISTLTDSLLIEILIRLPSTKEAVRTGTLSKRWEHVWTSIHTLIFEHKQSYNSLNPSLTNPNSMSDFISSVDKTLNQRRQLKLKKFVVGTSYDTQFESQVNNWIHYAIRCDVEELNLRFSSFGLGVGLLLDQNFFTSSSFVDLKLSDCIFNPTGAISWKNLKKLYIARAIIDEDLIENIQLGSPVLEILALNYCSGYKRLNLTSKSIKYVLFSGYMVPDDRFDASVIEINAPNIVYLTIQGALVMRKLFLGDVSSLQVADLDYNHFTKFGQWDPTHEKAEEETLERFIQNLHHVQELNIGESCHEVLYRLVAKGFEFTPNMRFPGVTPNMDCHDSESVESEDCDSDESGDCDCDSVENEDS